VNGASPILVTGIPRSGTSWVGKMLDAGGEVVYINEPLSDHHPPGLSPGILAAPVHHRFQYISEANEPPYLAAFRETLGLRYHALAEIKQNRAPRDLARMAKYWSSFTRGRLRNRRPLLDDPFAVFSAGWFADRLGCDVIAIVRHPAANAASRKRLGWRTDFRHLLRQPLLLEEWLHPFEAQMRALVRSPDQLAEGALLWRMAYHVAGKLRQRSPRLRVVRHEDLSLDPLGGYSELYGALRLPLSQRALGVIASSSNGGSPEKGHAWSGLSKTGFRPLDSRANAVKWKTVLTPEEVSRVRGLTEDVASLYYTEADWRR
jgi:Sulfotransferase family